jgi:hypothetical protein
VVEKRWILSRQQTPFFILLGVVKLAIEMIVFDYEAAVLFTEEGPDFLRDVIAKLA